MAGCVVLVDGFDGCDFGDAFLEGSFDAHAEGHVGGGASDAGAVHSDLDDAGGGHVDELDVAAVGLDGGTDEVDDGADLVVEGVWGAGLHG